jgi:hypothetical protein
VDKTKVHEEMSRTDAVLCRRIAQVTRTKKLSQGRKARIQFLVIAAFFLFPKSVLRLD